MDTGNDDDGEEKPVVPVKTVDKVTARSGKRDAPKAAPDAPAPANNVGGGRGGRGGRGDRSGGFNANETGAHNHIHTRKTTSDISTSFPRQDDWS